MGNTILSLFGRLLSLPNLGSLALWLFLGALGSHAVSAASPTVPTLIVSAGADREADLGDHFDLRGSATMADQPTSRLRYRWTQVAGPITTLTNSHSAHAWFIPRRAGDYRFSLRASDGNGSEGSATITVRVHPEIVINSPSEGQVLHTGENLTVAWTSAAIDTGRKLAATLRRPDGKVLHKSKVRAGIGAYTFLVKPKYLNRLRTITICLPKSSRNVKLCDSRTVEVVASGGLGPGPTPGPSPGPIASPGLRFISGTAGFTILQGSSPASQTLRLDTSDHSATRIALADDADWLTATSSGGTTPDSVTLAVNSTDLAPGTYRATVTASASGYANATLAVTLEVRARDPGSATQLLFSAASVNFAAPSGTPSRAQAIDLFTNNGSPVHFSLSDNVNWLTLSPDAGTTKARVGLSVSTNGLPPGDYRAVITAAAPGVASAQVPVRLVVDPPVQRTLLSDHFSDGNADGWTIVDEVASANPAWEVVSGVFRQSNFMGQDLSARQQGYYVGTYAYLGSSLGLTNYQFNVKATPLSETGIDVGVLFRYRDPDNYYRLVSSAAGGYTRIEKKVAGQFSTLAKSARGYVRGVPLNVNIVAQGSLFHVSINGDRLFSFRDTSFNSGGVALYCRNACAFDDIDILETSSVPAIAVSNPVAYSVSTESTFEVSAIVLNEPPGGVGVDFALAGDPNACSPARETQPGLYEAQCSSAAGRTGDLVASLRGVNGLLDADANRQIGVGNQYVAVGDSITFGLNDNYSRDDAESHGRVISSGYSSVLAELLNRGNAVPAVVFNNGLPGATTSEELSADIDGILARHSDANSVLLLLGTNDANLQVPHGIGCTTPEMCAGTFKGNMLGIIKKIKAAGKTPIVGRVPARFDAQRGALTRDYNAVIASELGLTASELGPDFYEDFRTRVTLFSDSLHPNALGYRVMAQLWYNFITRSSGLPFTLTGICVRLTEGGACQPSSALYKQNLLEAGDAYYIDQNVRLDNVPSELDGGIWITPRNSDKGVTATNYLGLSFPGTTATVYVAYDDGAAALPQWLRATFIRTASIVRTNNPAAPVMRLYRRDNVTSGIALGGNMATGAAGTPENYLAIVKPQ